MKQAFTSPAFSWYPKDHQGSERVALMTLEEEGAYRRALDSAWLNCGLPNDAQSVANIVGKGCTIAIAEKILAMFKLHPKDPTRAICLRQEIERKKQKENSKKRSEAGRLSGVKRREKRDLTPEQKLNKRSTNAEHSDSVSLSPIPIDDFKRLILRAREAFPTVDERVVEIGMLQTLLQRNGSTEPIRSVRYFDPEIKNVYAAKLGDNALDVMLARRREQFFGEQS